MSFFISPFGEKSVCDELNAFLKDNAGVPGAEFAL
jgi:hypothetical protein